LLPSARADFPAADGPPVSPRFVCPAARKRGLLPLERPGVIPQAPRRVGACRAARGKQAAFAR